MGISAINSVAQTSDGYIWIAGTAGILRFDGVRFVEWKPPANYSLPRRPLHSLLATKDGSLWIAGTGLAELRPNGEFRRFEQMDTTDIDVVFEDKDGGVWASGTGRSQGPNLCHFYFDRSECFSAGNPFGTWAGALHQDSDGQLLICASNGIWRLRPGPLQKIAPSSGANKAFALDRDASGTLVLTTGEHMIMTGADGKLQPYPIDVGLARALLKDKESDQSSRHELSGKE